MNDDRPEGLSDNEWERVRHDREALKETEWDDFFRAIGGVDSLPINPAGRPEGLSNREWELVQEQRRPKNLSGEEWAIVSALREYRSSHSYDIDYDCDCNVVKRYRTNVPDTAVRELLYDLLRLHLKIDLAMGDKQDLSDINLTDFLEGVDVTTSAMLPALMILGFDYEDFPVAGMILTRLVEQLKNRNTPPQTPDVLSRFLEEAKRRGLSRNEMAKKLRIPVAADWLNGDRDHLEDA
jgi:hypothetical protein